MHAPEHTRVQFLDTYNRICRSRSLYVKYLSGCNCGMLKVDRTAEINYTLPRFHFATQIYNTLWFGVEKITITIVYVGYMSAAASSRSKDRFQVYMFASVQCQPFTYERIMNTNRTHEKWVQRPG